MEAKRNSKADSKSNKSLVRSGVSSVKNRFEQYLKLKDLPSPKVEKEGSFPLPRQGGSAAKRARIEERLNVDNIDPQVRSADKLLGQDRQTSLHDDEVEFEVPASVETAVFKEDQRES